MFEKELEHEELLDNNIALLRKYCLATLWLKVGHAQLISRKPISDFDEAKNDPDLVNPLPHIRKILSTDRRVIDIQDFPKIDKPIDTTFTFSHIISDFYLPLKEQKPDKEIKRLAINIGNPIIFKLKLEPDLDQKQLWEEMYKYDPSVTEECWVFWNAEIFIACTFDSNEAIKYFGHKTRDVLKNIFKESEVFYCENLGPSPIHPDFISHVLSLSAVKKDSTMEEVEKLIRAPFNGNRDIYCASFADSSVELDIIKHVSVRSICTTLLRINRYFYDAIFLREALLFIKEECLNLFKEIIGELKLLQQVPFYNLVSRNTKCKALAISITQIHELLLDEYEVIAEINEHMMFMESNLEEDYFYRLLKDYYIEHAKENVKPMDREIILSALTHGEQVLDQHSTFRKDLTFAILGAIIGAALTLAGAYLNHLIGTKPS